ncbi:MAG TPA: NAD(P)-binding domain-containing protein [Thermoleophilaceae bacterium]
MNIGIIGSGRIGATVAWLLTRAGHEVALANSRGPDTLAEHVGKLGPRAHATTAAKAATFGDVVVVAVPVKAFPDLPAEQLSGKVVVDTGNYYPQRDGNIEELDDDTTTSTELLGRQLSGARLVKAFNTMYWENLRDDGRPDAPRDDRLAVFLAGDDEDAKKIVSGLIEEIGFAPVDTGSLAEGGRRQQPGSPIYGSLLKAPEAEAALA